MPIRLDHEEQRLQIARASAEAIARFGIERVRLLDIARAAGCTTGRLAYYYSSKEELLVDTWRYTRSLGLDLVRAANEATANDPFRLFDALLPLDGEGVMRWQVALAVADRALRDPGLAAERKLAHQQIVDVLHRALQDWAARLDHDPVAEEDANLLWIFIWGLGTQALCDPQSWPPDAMRSALRIWVNRLTAIPS